MCGKHVAVILQMKQCPIITVSPQNNTRAGKALEPLTDEELARLLDDAESLCLDLLEND